MAAYKATTLIDGFRNAVWLVALLAVGGVSASYAQELVCPNLFSDDEDLVSLQDFDANDFCIGLTRGLTSGDTCISGISQGDPDWSVKVSRSSGGYTNNYRVFVLGPSGELSGFVPGGYEMYEMEVVTFIGLNCLAAYYPVVSLSMYHTGSRERAMNSRDHNWEHFSPGNIIQIRDTFMNHAGRYAVELMEGRKN